MLIPRGSLPESADNEDPRENWQTQLHHPNIQCIPVKLQVKQCSIFTNQLGWLQFNGTFMYNLFY